MHFLQSTYWRVVKEKLGNKTYDFKDGWFQVTKLPLINKNIGYVPRVDIETLDWQDLFTQAKRANCAYVTVDPINIEKESKFKIPNSELLFDKAKPVHLQHNVEIDLTADEKTIFERMERKYRYNIRLAEKKEIKTWVGNTPESFEVFLDIYLETKSRQKFFGRNEEYLTKVWNTLRQLETEYDTELVKIAIAYLNDEPLVAWMIFLFDGVVYYPYGGSKDLHREFKPTYKIAWEVLKWAKANGCKKFDFWGIEEDYKASGFSSYKLGFGGEIVKYADSMNLIIDPKLYKVLKVGMKARDKLSVVKKLF